MKLFLTAICLSLLGFLTSCSPNAGNRDSHAHDSGRPAPDFPTNVTMYEVKGVLREIRAEGWKALIAHEDIPGYMEAMTMQLDVKDTNELRGLLPGDQISFRMLVTDDDGWIDRVKRIGSTVTSNPPPAQPVIAVDQLNPGSLLPDFTLTNQFGQPMHLKDFKGRAFAFTFIFTRCPFPTFCPRMNNNFAEAQRLLASDNTRTNWSLISISFDSEYDTPERLSAYSSNYHPDTARWSFATGDDAIIRRLGSAFGLTYAKEGALYNHNVRTVVADTQGRVQKIFPNNEWKPEELVSALQQAMQE